jgi:hypothetical protein
VSDGIVTVSQTVHITVREVNVAPTLTSPGDQSLDELTSVSFTLNATDADLLAGLPNSLSYSIASGTQPGMTLNAVTGAFSWTPTESQDGPYSVTFRVTDDGNPGLDDTKTVTITVREVNTAPVLAPIGDQVVGEGSTLTFTATALDADRPANALAFSLVGASSGAAIHPVTGVFTWTPTEVQGPGTFTFTVRVTDNGTPALFDEKTITVTVNEVNTPPVLDPIPDQTFDEETVLAFTVTVHDSDLPANTLILSAVGLPSGATFDPGTGKFSWTPTEAQDGTYSFDLRVNDGTVMVSQTVHLTVREVNRPPIISNVTDQSSNGAALGPIGFTVGDAETPAANLTVVATSSNAALVPNANILLGGSGASRTVKVTPVAGQSGSTTITLRVTDASGAFATKTFVVTVTPAATLVGFKRFAVGADAGGGAVTVYNPDGSVHSTITPFPGTAGGVRTTVADFNGDGTPDLAVGTGPGTIAEVKVFDGGTGSLLFDIRPFDAFTGGVFVAAGFLVGNGSADLVVTPDVSGGPRVVVYEGGDFQRVANFFGIEDPNFRGGARAAVGDLDGDGHAELTISAGFGGGPRISIFDGAALLQGQYVHPIHDFFAFESSLRNGVYLAVGDVNGSGVNDVIFGAGPGGGPRVLIVSGQTLLSQGATAAIDAPIANFFAGDPKNRGGVRVAVKNLDDDRYADVVTGAGESGGSRITSYLGKNLAIGAATEEYGFDVFPGFTGGVFVG